MTLVLFARDTGAANQVVAVADVFAGRLHCPQIAALAQMLAGQMPSALKIWGLGPALNVYAAAGMPSQECNPDDVVAASTLLLESAARILITGTGDIDDRVTPMLWRAASQSGIPSVALLDSADNIGVRFDLAGRAKPDRFVAPDQRTKKALQSAGVADREILQVDNLHHARLAALPKANRHEIRRAWGVGAESRVILFASENAAEAREMGRAVDFDEFSLLTALINDVGARRPVGWLRGDEDMVVVVRPHPRDLPGKYDRYARLRDPRVVVSALGAPIDAIAGADLVVGMRSAFLDEALILGRPVHRLI